MAISPFNKPRDFHRSTGDDRTPWCGVRAVGQSRSPAGWPGSVMRLRWPDELILADGSNGFKRHRWLQL